MDNEIVFQSSGMTIEDEIDVRIDIAIDHLAEVADVGDPLRAVRIVVIGVAVGDIIPHNLGVGIGPDQVHIHTIERSAERCIAGGMLEICRTIRSFREGTGMRPRGAPQDRSIAFGLDKYIADAVAAEEDLHIAGIGGIEKIGTRLPHRVDELSTVLREAYASIGSGHLLR
jgi:hypothetical protein